MKGYGIVLFTFIFAAYGCAACAVDYSGNVVIGANEVINDDIHITNDTTIENFGTINGNIIFDDAYDLIIKNHSSIGSNFTLNPGATITQVVSTNADIHVIDNLSGHTLKIQDGNMLNMTDIIAIAGNALEIRMFDSSIVVGANTPDIGIPIHLDSDDTIVIDGTGLSESCTLISHVYGIPMITTNGIDPMYVATPSMVAGALKVQMMRQTNYSIVFGGELGNYLDGLRTSNSEDKLIRQLDSANTRGALNRVMSQSARLKPILLSEPMQIFNSLRDTSVFNNTNSMASIVPLYISSDDFEVWGGAINLSGKMSDKIFAKFGLFGGMLNYDGKFDEYKSFLYGGTFDVVYNTDDYYLGTFGTITYANFKDISVFDDGKISKNPSGFSGRFGIDVGPIYEISDEIKIAPFIGGTIDYAKILNNNDTDFNARTGFDMIIDTAHDGNKYTTGLRAFVQTDGGIYAALYSNMLSIADGVGVGLNLGALYDDSILSYKIMLDANFLF